MTKHLPQSYTGQRFCRFFNHRFNFIKSSYSSTPEWITISDYPIEHRNLWSMYQDPERLIGLSFGTTTHYAVLDIDRQSPYHPGNSEAQYRELLGAYEEVGINSIVTVQSSNSEGLHVYFVFPKALPTFKLAHMLRLTANKAGYEVKDGKLEIFPNTKGYSKHSKTAYKALRLPLQRGSYLLDKDFVPYSNEIEVFLEQGEAAAEEQDIELIETAIESASHIKHFRRVKGEADACSFAQDLREQIAEGWTSFGQTNDLLRIISTYGRVFKGLEGQALADYIVETAESSPGYQKYCRHKHNIHRRAKDWGRCIEKYYYPYGSEPSRIGSFNDLQKKGCRPENPPKENLVNQSRQKGAIERIKQGMEYLSETVKVLPRKVGELKELLIGAIKEIFGIRASDKTLARYKEFWHPQCIKLADLEISSLLPSAVTEPEFIDRQIEVITEKTPQVVKEEPELGIQSDSASNNFIDTGLENPIVGQSSAEVPFVSTQLPKPRTLPKSKSSESLPRESSKLCPTPTESSLKKDSENKLTKLKCDKSSKIYAPPSSYMKVYILTSQAVGLISKRFHGKPSSSKLCSISSGTEVRICRGAKHSRHPELLYVKPCEGADNWIGGIAVLSSSLELVN
ncbi:MULTISPECIES: hypothetical protein [Synechocystis]|uniref:hypothetical protein n=1 Tax=Synechocystis TaxID=1142 RepID=UPI001D152657|nr:MULTISPECIES: hypothetical protein [Synechocystis]